MHEIFIILLVIPVVVYSCNDATHYPKDGQCCMMCPPGKRWTTEANCLDPFCPDCKAGEYQDVYNKDITCKLQPFCDPNLNFVNQTNPSTTERSPCQCIPGHHCSTASCETCVKNTVCQAGQKVRKRGNRTSDTECENCPDGTFSDKESASTCQPWTECASGFSESVRGTHQSDRICKVNVKPIVFAVVGVLFLAVLGFLFFWYKRGRTGTLDLEKKLQKHCGGLFRDTVHKQTPNDAALENMLPQTPLNQPEEDTEDQLKNGLSANGMPVRQDNSKSSLTSQPETATSAGSSYKDLQ